MQHINHRIIGIECDNSASKLEAVLSFYANLYIDEIIDEVCLRNMLDKVDKVMSDEDASMIVEPISFEYIQDGSNRSPSHSSPGHIFPYEILHLIIPHPDCRALVTQVYNDTINLAIFPKSWQETCIILIPKKGDLADLTNWRPISLINTDCKVFTRLLNARVIKVASSLITK
jgi:hypothetical protein